MALDKLTYQRTLLSKEPQVIEFKVANDLTIEEYKRTCKRMALALEQFGKDIETGDPNQLKLLFD